MASPEGRLAGGLVTYRMVELSASGLKVGPFLWTLIRMSLIS